MRGESKAGWSRDRLPRSYRGLVAHGSARQATTARTVLPSLLILTLAVLSLGLTAAVADDKGFFAQDGAKPYVFAIIDTSSSMRRRIDGQRPPCAGDDPSSRLYVAKAALWGVLSEPELANSVNFGWAHFATEEYNVLSKHWLYSRDVASPRPTLVCAAAVAIDERRPGLWAQSPRT